MQLIEIAELGAGGENDQFRQAIEQMTDDQLSQVWIFGHKDRSTWEWHTMQFRRRPHGFWGDEVRDFLSNLRWQAVSQNARP